VPIGPHRLQYRLDGRPVTVSHCGKRIVTRDAFCMIAPHLNFETVPSV
jgi:hypothetical protein